MFDWFRSLFAPPPAFDSSDPFADPAVQHMSSAQLADLPLAPPPAPRAQRQQCRDGLTRPAFRVTAGHVPG